MSSFWVRLRIANFHLYGELGEAIVLANRWEQLILKLNLEEVEHNFLILKLMLYFIKSWTPLSFNRGIEGFLHLLGYWAYGWSTGDCDLGFHYQLIYLPSIPHISELYIEWYFARSYELIVSSLEECLHGQASLKFFFSKFTIKSCLGFQNELILISRSQWIPLNESRSVVWYPLVIDECFIYSICFPSRCLLDFHTHGGCTDKSILFDEMLITCSLWGIYLVVYTVTRNCLLCSLLNFGLSWLLYINIKSQCPLIFSLRK